MKDQPLAKSELGLPAFVHPDQGAGRPNHARVTDPEHRWSGGIELVEGGADPGGQHGDTFPSMGARSLKIGGPGIEFRTGDQGPWLPLPAAEIELYETRVDGQFHLPRRGDALGEQTTAAQGARHDASDRGKFPQDRRGVALEPGIRSEVGASITETLRAFRSGMAEQDQSHARRPR